MPPTSSHPLPACARRVHSFDELLSTPFEHGVNALCWARDLQGDFAEVVRALALPPGITPLSPHTLLQLPLSPAGQQAVRVMLSDLELLHSHGLQPSLDGIHGYTQPLAKAHLRTDVCSFHADSATAEADTWLCTYHGASTLGLPNDHAIPRIDHPASRAALVQHYGGPEDAHFSRWLSEHFHDLHYLPGPQAQPYAFGIGHLWRIATDHPGCPVPPCIHRAPDPVPGQPRLLLIS